MFDDPICRLCHHLFKDHRSGDEGMHWYCEAKGGCPCDNFVVDMGLDNDWDKFYLN